MKGIAMKNIIKSAQFLLGFIFLVFGLNGFYVFIEPPQMAADGASFMGILISSGYLYVVKSIEVVGGVLLLVNRYKLLAITLLTPVAINIFLFHLFLDMQNLFIGILLITLTSILIYGNRTYFKLVFKQNVD